MPGSSPRQGFGVSEFPGFRKQRLLLLDLHLGGTRTVLETASVRDSDCQPLSAELALCHHACASERVAWTGPGACLGDPSGTSYIERQVSLPSTYCGTKRQRQRESLAEEMGFLMTWRPSDRFIWGQTAKCTDIYRSSALTWGSVTEGDCAREPGMRKYGQPAARDYCGLYLKMGFQVST